jgi:hypothetical protein
VENLCAVFPHKEKTPRYAEAGWHGTAPTPLACLGLPSPCHALWADRSLERTVNHAHSPIGPRRDNAINGFRLAPRSLGARRRRTPPHWLRISASGVDERRRVTQDMGHHVLRATLGSPQPERGAGGEEPSSPRRCVGSQPPTRCARSRGGTGLNNFPVAPPTRLVGLDGKSRPAQRASLRSPPSPPSCPSCEHARKTWGVARPVHYLAFPLDGTGWRTPHRGG